jgi:hypothetical protein
MHMHSPQRCFLAARHPELNLIELSFTTQTQTALVCRYLPLNVNDLPAAAALVLGTLVALALDELAAG